MKKIVLMLIALLLVSCMPDVKETPPTPPPVEEEEEMEEEIEEKIEVNPLVGYWIGRNEFIRFREDGTFQFTVVYFGGSMDTYNGEWSMTEDGKLTAIYVRKSGTLYITTYVAYDSELRWRSEDRFDYPNPYGGTYYFTRGN